MDADAEMLVRKKFDLFKPVSDGQVRRLWPAAEAQVFVQAHRVRIAAHQAAFQIVR